MKTCLGLLVAVCCFALLASDVDAQRKKRGRKMRRSDHKALKVAEMAPEFKIKSLDGKSEFDLAESKKDKKPIVLIFGSYT